MATVRVTILDGNLPTTVKVQKGCHVSDVAIDLGLKGRLQPPNNSTGDCTDTPIVKDMVFKLVKNVVQSAPAPADLEMATAMNQAVEAQHQAGLPDVSVVEATTADGTTFVLAGSVNGRDGLNQVLKTVSVDQADHGSTEFICNHWKIFDPATNGSILAGLGTAPLKNVTDALGGLTLNTTRPFILSTTNINGNQLLVGTPDNGAHTHLSARATVTPGNNWATSEQVSALKSMFFSNATVVDFRTKAVKFVRSPVDWARVADLCTSTVLQPCLDWFARFAAAWTAAGSETNVLFAKTMATFSAIVSSMHWTQTSPTLQNMKKPAKFTYQPQLWRDFWQAVSPVFYVMPTPGDRTEMIAKRLNQRASISGYREKTPVLVARGAGVNFVDGATTVVVRFYGGGTLVKTGFVGPVASRIARTAGTAPNVFTADAENSDVRCLRVAGVADYVTERDVLIVNMPNKRFVMIPRGPPARLGLPSRRADKIAAAATATNMATWSFYVKNVSNLTKSNGSFAIPVCWEHAVPDGRRPEGDDQQRVHEPAARRLHAGSGGTVHDQHDPVD